MGKAGTAITTEQSARTTMVATANLSLRRGLATSITGIALVFRLLAPVT